METTKENTFEKHWISYSQNNIIFQFDFRLGLSHKLTYRKTLPLRKTVRPPFYILIFKSIWFYTDIRLSGNMIIVAIDVYYNSKFRYHWHETKCTVDDQ